MVAQGDVVSVVAIDDVGLLDEKSAGLIEMLLRPFRAGSDADAFDWTLIDRLTPFGGIRVEDNILVTEDAGRNLTREAFSAG